MTHASDDIAADFLIEAQEIAERLGEQLVSLEHAPTDSDLLNAVFRGFHTIKGGAGFLNLVPMVDVCHAVEEPFNDVRSGKRPLDAELFDGAQAALDHLYGMLDALAQGQPLTPAPPDLLARLLAPPGSAVALMAAPASAAVAGNGGDEISDDEFESLLDQLHGDGAPTAVAAPAAPAPVAAARPAAPAPKPAGRAEAGVETTLRIDTKRLDAIVNLVGELVLARNRLKTLRGQSREDELDRAVGALDGVTSRLQAAVMKTRMQPVGRVFGRFPKLARDVARAVQKEVDLDVEGAETELDRTLVDALADPLVHLVRNAIDHGIEAPAKREAIGKSRVGRVVLSARQEGDHIAIEVRDDGGGMDPEILRAKAREKGLLDAEAAARLSTEECFQLVFMPGFSTKAAVTDISGRGVGMDVVQSRIRELNGRVTIQSKLGEGTRFLVRLPLTLAILPALLVRSAERVFALPLASVQEVLPFRPDALRWVEGREILDLRDAPLPLLFLRRWLGEASAGNTGHIVLVQTGEGRVGLVVDQVRGREEVVIKPLPKAVRGLPGHVGATLTGDGKLAMILDVDALSRAA